VSALDDLDEVIEQCQRALDKFVKGTPQPMQMMFSHREDVSLANPFGPPARGWDRGRSHHGPRRIESQGWRDGRLRESSEVRDPRARLHRVAREAGGQARRQDGHNPIHPAGYDGLSTRRRHLEGSAPARGPHNHGSTSRVGDPRVDPPRTGLTELYRRLQFSCKASAHDQLCLHGTLEPDASKHALLYFRRHF
jgi:hypothetical protein